MEVECPFCEESFNSQKALKIHKTKMHQNKKVEDIEKIRTGIKGFDNLMKEGIPKGSSILVEGGPGSGKTIFCLQIARNTVKNGEKVLYMSFEEPVKRLISHMKGFNWDIEKHFEEDNLRIKRYSALDIARSVEALLSEAKRELLIEVKPMLFPEDFEPDLVVIDSLTSIASAFSGERARFRIYMEQLFKYLEEQEITSFLIRETPNPTHIGKSGGAPGGGAVSFLSDGIVALYNAIHPSGTRDRGIEIVKMRGEDFKSGIVEMEIISEKGMGIRPEEHLESNYTLT